MIPFSVRECLAELKQARSDHALLARIEHRVQNRRAKGNAPTDLRLVQAGLFSLRLSVAEVSILLQVVVSAVEKWGGPYFKTKWSVLDDVVKIKAIQHVGIQQIRSRLCTIYKSKALQVMVADLHRRGRQYKLVPEGVILLSLREAEYLRSLLVGKPVRALVDSHRHSFLKKFGVSSLEDLVGFCRDIGLSVPLNLPK